jgi:hypothetical protein
MKYSVPSTRDCTTTYCCLSPGYPPNLYTQILYSPDSQEIPLPILSTRDRDRIGINKADMGNNEQNGWRFLAPLGMTECGGYFWGRSGDSQGIFDP